MIATSYRMEGNDRLSSGDAMLTVIAEEARTFDLALIADDMGVTTRLIDVAGWLLEDHPLPSATIACDLTGLSDDQADHILPDLAQHASTLGSGLIVLFHAAQIDLVAPALIATPAQLLCDPGPLDIAAALALALHGQPHGRLHDIRRDDSDHLERLNAEVARIAETLARLRQREGSANGDVAQTVADRALTFGFQPAPISPAAVDARTVRDTIRARRLRDQHLGGGLFEDPAWDILLDLFAAELERAKVSVSSLCIAAAVAPTTALRWIAKLSDAGLLHRSPDPFDKRRAFISLSDTASQAMRSYASALAAAGLTFV